MTEWNIELVTVPTTGLQMELAEAGSGPLMVMLHGFPEMMESWRHQINYFSEKGYKTVAPNMRGYGASGRPRKGYDVDTLADDVAGLFDHYGADKAILVAHDWGGVVAWHFAYRYPGRLEALIILNAPHPVRFDRQLRGNISQLRKSYYVFMFQIPFLPEWFLGRRRARMVGEIIRKTAVRKDAFSDEDIEKYSLNMSTPGALRAGIEYYRRALRDAPKLRKFYKGKKISAPTLVIWAQQDAFLGPELANSLESFFDAPLEISPIHNCGHWVQNEAPEEVNAAIDKFLSDNLK